MVVIISVQGRLYGTVKLINTLKTVEENRKITNVSEIMTFVMLKG